MRFSLIYKAQGADASGASDRKVVVDTVEQAMLAEEMELDFTWAAEHVSARIKT